MKNFILSLATSANLIHTPPPIYIYTDFGGGKNTSELVSDLQTSGEIASAAWKATKQPTLYINDSAAPLDPLQAALRLNATFPYTGKTADAIQTIVVHVIDPGVGNNQHAEPRSAILRKDGVLFIGPDNGTLSFVCPPGSIAKAVEIDPDRLDRLTGIDTKSGGTFHGRDLFSETAFRIAAGAITLDEIGTNYSTLDVLHRWEEPALQFAKIDTSRIRLNAGGEDLFEKAFLLGVIQSPIDSRESAPKLFLIDSEEEKIAVINYKTGNVFVGPNNGLATAFFKHYALSDLTVHSISSEAYQTILNESDPKKACLFLRKQPTYGGRLNEIAFLGEPSEADPRTIQARIWVDAYGNLKTTLPSSKLHELRGNKANIRVTINGVERPVIFANTFSEVPENQLFLYAGSSGVIGPNPHRSERYVELTSNGVYGKFGVDFFINQGRLPKSGDVATFTFD